MANVDNTPPPYEDISDSTYSKLFMERLNKFLYTQKYTDVTLKADKVEIQCHRVILAAASDYFDTMFSSGLKESTSDVVELKETNSEALTSIVNYVYSSNIRITTDNVQSLVQASDQFRFMGLLAHCETFMVRHVSSSNAAGFYRFSGTYNFKRLKAAARINMLKNFEPVVRSADFSNMTVEEIIEYIADDGLDVPSEEAVFEAVCMWMRIAPQEREPLFSQILEHVRLPLCSMLYLSRSVASFHLIMQEESHKYLQEAFLYHADPERAHQHTSPRTKPRVASTTQSCLVEVGSIINHFKTSLDVNYLKEGCSWETLTQLPKQMHSFNAVVVRSGIFITGGVGDGKTLNSCWLFDITDRQWNTMPSMIEARCGHGSVVHNERIYVVGGNPDIESVNTLSSMERYDQKLKQWSLLQAMPKPLAEVTAVSNGQHIYALSARVVDLFVYDTVWGKWEQKMDSPIEACCWAAACVNDKIYVIGAMSSDFMSYDMQLDSWTVLTSSPRHMWSHAIICWQGKLLIGGDTCTSMHDYRSVIDVYDPEEDTWLYSAVPPCMEMTYNRLLCLDGHNI